MLSLAPHISLTIIILSSMQDWFLCPYKNPGLIRWLFRTSLIWTLSVGIKGSFISKCILLRIARLSKLFVKTAKFNSSSRVCLEKMYQPPGSDEVSWAPKDDDRLTFNDDLQIIIYLNLPMKDHLISSKG